MKLDSINFVDQYLEQKDCKDNSMEILKSLISLLGSPLISRNKSIDIIFKCIGKNGIINKV